MTTVVMPPFSVAALVRLAAVKGDRLGGFVDAHDGERRSASRA